MALGGHPFGYERPARPRLVRATEWVSLRRARAGRPLAAVLAPVAAVVRVALFAWAVARHDVFVFGFGTSFFRLRELWLLRALGKRVIFQFNGSDDRPPYLDGAVIQEPTPEAVERVVTRTREIKRALGRIERHAHHVVTNPTSGHLHEREIVVWLKLGLATRPPLVAEPGGGSSERVRVLHCPSDLGAKGTTGIRAAVQRLADEGLPIEYVEITGSPHAVVLDELARCDLVVDQLFSDYPMPGFATEAAWYGKPVLIGGYAVELWRRALEPDEHPPTAYCAPADLAAELRRLVVDGEARRELGDRARAFVEARWSPRAVAGRYLRVVAGDVPQEWLYDPRELDYVHGAGLEESAAGAIVAAVVSAAGVESLCVGDKPELERALITLPR